MADDGDVSPRAGRDEPSGVPVARAGVSGRVLAARRESIVDAMMGVIAEHGYQGASVESVCARARISRRTFYEVFPSFEECFLAILDRGMETMAAVMQGAFAGQGAGRGEGEGEGDWLDTMLATEAAVLAFLDGEPEFARVLLVDALGAGSWALERRQDNVGALRDLIVEQFKDTPLGGDFPPLAAAGVMASLLGIMHEHLLKREPAPLISLLGPLMGVITTPYLPARDVAREIRRGEELAERIQAEREALSSLARAQGGFAENGCGGTDRDPDGSAALEIPALLRNARAARARQCVLYLAEQGRRGLNPSNQQIAAAIGIANKGQMSKLLKRLESHAIVSKFSHGSGRPNVWSLTPYGEELAVNFELGESR
jgi:AcrR family transcriptional regulator